MKTVPHDPSYVIHSDDEPLRLERQARIYGTEDDLRFVQLRSDEFVLDAGCGSGSAARLFARQVPEGRVVGLDRDATYLDYARRTAVAEGLTNIEFEAGDVLALPFKDASFDVAWSKHLLQWVERRSEALSEFVRVTRPGGRVICSNFDGFCLSHYPTNEQVQSDVEQWFSRANAEFGFDNNLGRKLPHLFKAAGLKNIRSEIIPDRAFCGFGGDPERRWNWETQWHSALPFTEKVFGSEEVAQEVTDRIIQCFNDPNVFVYTTLFYVEGTVP